MFINGVEVISSRLENISLIQKTMQPKSERPPVCPKGQLPLLHLTPSGNAQKKSEGSPNHGTDNPCLLKPHHDIPPTPPPQTKAQPLEFFPQRIG
ncbi:hypothetical protein ABMA27_001499 [Loxostege sticticalis]|uniref:Uncharacterized protein n=1 Tax=Loxostege sticticalis TaxID=481309 RepID=A0ABR3HYP6_LOXSC